MGKPVNKVLFIHHSTGGLLLKNGNVRNLLRSKTDKYELWDHGYNLYPIPFFITKLIAPVTFHSGLSDKNGQMVGMDYDIVISNNSPKEYAEIFSRDSNDSTLRTILEYDVVIFKNCYPTTKIVSDKQLESYKKYYISIRNSISCYPDRLFIAFTPPPVRREVTTSENATRARKLVAFMTSDEFVHKNMKIFDFFDLLADSSGNNANMLKRTYTSPIPVDSHPNKRANREIGPKFVEFIISEADEFLGL